MSEALAAALRWADALDHDDFDHLPAFMATDCVYHAPASDLVGPEDIVDSYRQSSIWAHDTFDSITWDSSCELESDDTVLITFVDITQHQGQHHEYRCRQRVRFDADWRIAEITHISIPEEERLLADFFARVGVTR